ncbi:MAG TPA: hypothetical protein ENK18_18630, partial [Deltaproteobacteria bacterium]|nr:hypothetical protein [Deltaproteobacteria bacterium]
MGTHRPPTPPAAQRQAHPRHGRPTEAPTELEPHAPLDEEGLRPTYVQRNEPSASRPQVTPGRPPKAAEAQTTPAIDVQSARRRAGTPPSEPRRRAGPKIGGGSPPPPQRAKRGRGRAVVGAMGCLGS